MVPNLLHLLGNQPLPRIHVRNGGPIESRSQDHDVRLILPQPQRAGDGDAGTTPYGAGRVAAPRCRKSKNNLPPFGVATTRWV